MENFHDNEKAKKENSISSSEENYLDIIYSLKKTTLTKFAELAKITKPAATQIINKYIDKGYVTKSISEKDKRVCYIEVTEQVKKYFADSCKTLNKMYNDCLSFLTEEEMIQLSNILLKINENL
ncbi:MAG: winged helix-turn-helix transcriptional regulator [Bacilli bacterium]|nr:winged helix-turn-helix transcriptional regulator [Bacilli bacterium]